MFRRRLNSTFGASDTARARFQGRFILANPCINFVPEFEPTLKCPDVFRTMRIRSDSPLDGRFSWSPYLSNPSSAVMGRRLSARPS